MKKKNTTKNQQSQLTLISLLYSVFGTHSFGANSAGDFGKITKKNGHWKIENKGIRNNGFKLSNFSINIDKKKSINEIKQK